MSLSLSLPVVRCLRPVMAVLAMGLAGTASADHTPDPSRVVVPGSLQSELGCGGDWDPACPATEEETLPAMTRSCWLETATRGAVYRQPRSA